MRSFLVPLDDIGRPEVAKQMTSLQRTFYGDVKLILRTFLSEDPLDAHTILTFGAAIARKWIVEGQIGRVAKELSAKLSFVVPDTRPHRAFIDNDGGFLYYCAGNVVVDGPFMAAIYVHKNQMPQNADGMSIMPLARLTSVGLHQLQKMPSLYYDGTWFTLNDVIKLMSNKEGGVHIDTKPLDDTVLSFRRARAFASFGSGPTSVWNEETEVHFKVSDNTIEPYDCGHIELLSACQALIHARFDGKPLIKNPDEYWDRVENPQQRQLDIFRRSL